MDLAIFNFINPVKDLFISSVLWFDNTIFNGVNQYASKWVCLDSIGIFLAEYLPYILILIIAILAMINLKKYSKLVVESAISALVARFMVVEIIRWLWERPRPFVNNIVNQLIDHSSASFPSGHAAFFFAVSTIIYLYNKKLGTIFFLASVLIGIARVFSGIHWPSDILVGAVVGVVVAWIIHKIMIR